MIYAVGDIHGELSKLRSVLQQIEERASDFDQIVFVGDYVDRGPDVCGVIELLLQVQERRPNTIFLRGNHEQEMLDARDIWKRGNVVKNFSQSANWFSMGGSETIASYPRRIATRWYNRIPEHHWDFIEGTDLEYRAGPYLFVHAGIPPPGARWSDQDDPRLWIREPFLSYTGDLGHVVVFGHTPRKEGLPLVMSNKIGIDTAAAFGGPLTAVILDPERDYDQDELLFLRSA